MISEKDTPRRKRQNQEDQATTRLSGPTSPATSDMIRRFHTHPNPIPPGHCSSLHIEHISAPLPIVWSLISCFSRPQSYKPFVRSCHLCKGDGSIGSVRQIRVVSGLPATSSTERLDILDHEQHVFGFSIVGGDHRLSNYRSTMTVHSEEEGRITVVLESYEVEVPEGNTEEETCIFADTIVGCNLRSLAYVAEKMVRTATPPTA
ncbi:putative polyketide cyclase/dehydrase, START-like domain superfamily [Dioscorea sansibarensis]